MQNLYYHMATLDYDYHIFLHASSSIYLQEDGTLRAESDNILLHQ